jgi:hypothetical protein
MKTFNPHKFILHKNIAKLLNPIVLAIFKIAKKVFTKKKKIKPIEIQKNNLPNPFIVPKLDTNTNLIIGIGLLSVIGVFATLRYLDDRI